MTVRATKTSRPAGFDGLRYAELLTAFVSKSPTGKSPPMGLEMVEILMDVEEHFGISISDQVIGEIVTYGDLVHAIVAATQAQRPEAGVSQVAVDTYLRGILTMDHWVKPQAITPEAKLYADLGLG